MRRTMPLFTTKCSYGPLCAKGRRAVTDKREVHFGRFRAVISFPWRAFTGIIEV